MHVFAYIYAKKTLGMQDFKHYKLPPHLLICLYFWVPEEIFNHRKKTKVKLDFLMSIHPSHEKWAWTSWTPWTPWKSQTSWTFHTSWTKRTKRTSTTSPWKPEEGHGRSGTKGSILDQRLVCQVVGILYQEDKDDDSADGDVADDEPDDHLLALPSSPPWGRPRGWPCRRRWWSGWRTTRFPQLFLWRRPECAIISIVGMKPTWLAHLLSFASLLDNLQHINNNVVDRINNMNTVHWTATYLQPLDLDLSLAAWGCQLQTRNCNNVILTIDH